MKRLKHLIILLSVFALLFLSVGTYSWTSKLKNRVNPSVDKGVIVGQYFHSGDGSKENPFVITRPIHYFHLVELYQRNSQFANSGFHFQLGTDINEDGNPEVFAYDDDGLPLGITSYSNALNMNGYRGEFALLPIGTSETPFDTTFEGNGLTVKNLNVIAEETVESTTYGTADVGVFGYLGDNAVIQNLYIDNLIIDLTNLNVTEINPEGHNADIHINGTKAVGYVGYIAGHIKYQSTLNNVYVNNATILGGTSSVSAFGYVGAIENIGGEMATNLGDQVALLRTKGSGAGWGGSIAMDELYERLYQIADDIENTGSPIYTTKETVIVDEEGRVLARYSIETANDIGSHSGYRLTLRNYSSTLGGSYTYNIYNDYSPYIYLTGETEYQTKTVTTYTLQEDTTVTAYYICDTTANNYLGVSQDLSIANMPLSKATKWMLDDSNHLYTLIGLTNYYLTYVGNTLKIIPSTSSDTPVVWTIEENSKGNAQIYNGDYYIMFDGIWQMSTMATTMSITDGNGHYLAINGNKIESVEDIGSSSEWETVLNGSAVSLRTTVGDGVKYLGYVAGTGLTLVSDEFLWNQTVNGNKYAYSYTDGQGTVWYLGYLEGFKAIVNDGYYVSCNDGGEDIYLTASRFLNDVSSVSTPTYYSLWQLNVSADQTTICFQYNGKKYYLGADLTTGEITFSETSTVWNKSPTGQYYVIYNEMPYYLTYNNGWRVETSSKHYLEYDGNYLSVDNSASIVNLTTPTESASAWSMDVQGEGGYVYIVIDGTVYYLCANEDKTLSLRTNRDEISDGDTVITPAASLWNTDSVGFYTFINGSRYYIVYEGTWKIVEEYFTFRVSTWYMHYSSKNGSWIVDATNDSTLNNIRWKCDEDSIWMVQNGVNYYVTFVRENDAPILSTTENNDWVVTENSIISKDGQWQLTNLGSVWVTVRTSELYRLTVGGHNLRVNKGAIDDQTASSDRLCHWIIDMSTGTIGQVYDGEMHYLNADNSVLSVSTEKITYWYLDNDTSLSGTYYYIVNDTLRRYIAYDGTWKTVEGFWYNVTDGTNYLYFDGDTKNSVGNTQSTASSTYNTSWQVYAVTGDTAIYQVWSKVAYYLTCDANGKLAITNTKTVWHKDEQGYYLYSGLYLSYDVAGGWVAKPLTYNLITDELENYLTYNGSSFTNVNTTGEATKWYFSGTKKAPNQIFTYVNGERKYLSLSGSTIVLSSTPINWTITNGSLYYNNYWIVYDGGWKTVTTPSAYYIAYELDDVKYFLSESIRTGSTTGNTTFTAETDRDGTLVLNFSVTTDPKNPSGTASYKSGTRTRYFFIDSFDFIVHINYLRTNTSNSGSWTNEGGYLKNDNLSSYMAFDESDIKWRVSDSKPSKPMTLVVYGGIEFESATDTGAHVGERQYLNNWASKLAKTELYNNPETAKGNYPSDGYGQEAPAIGTIAGIEFTYTERDIPLLELPEREKDSTIKKIATTGQKLSNPVVQGNVSSGTSTYIPLRLALQNEDDPTSFYSDYRVDSGNTGYIIAGSNETSSSYRSDIRVSRYNTSDIYRALNTSSSRSPNYNNTYDSQLQVITRTATSNGYVRIKDSRNGDNMDSYNSGLPSTYMTVTELGLTKYEKEGQESSRDAFADMLMGTNRVYGLHFMNALISKDNIIYADQATVLGKTYYNYELPEDCIDFNVNERGAVNFFSGTYYSSNVTAFFSLHQVIRDGNQHITDIKEIVQVYAHNTRLYSNYIYKYKDGTYSSEDFNPADYYLIFDLQWITNPSNLVQNAVYYFEIPLNKGEYALGSVEGKTGAYLLYLDVAANGGSPTPVIISNEGVGAASNMTVDFRDYPDTSNYALMQFAVNIPETANKEDVTVTVSFVKEGLPAECELGLYVITINNESEEEIKIDVVLTDDDTDLSNDYKYAYSIVYTNSTNTSAKIIFRDDLYYWQAVATFIIPSEGDAYEINDYS